MSHSLLSFNETVRGYLHILRENPCEDSSASFSSDDNRCHIAVVADGHGDDRCFRSSVGSKMVAEIALVCLKAFAEATLSSAETEERFYTDMSSNLRYQTMAFRQLTDTIIAKWYDSVLEDYSINPPSEEELALESGEVTNIPHVYGTTLIAALQLPKGLLLLQQGDGRCDVFYADGTIDQPIPWDSRCEDTMTTSLCDKDATESIRSCYIDLSKTPVIACFLGTDGVEDAYRDSTEDLGGSHSYMGGVHTFYKYLTCQLLNGGHDYFSFFLKEMLPDFSKAGLFSKAGSGDDVSVAGIVDFEAVSLFEKQFENDIKRYSLDEELFLKDKQLKSKTRKHGILSQRVDEAQKALSDAQAEQLELETLLQKLISLRDDLNKELNEAKTDLDKTMVETQQLKERIDGQYPSLAKKIKEFLENLSVSKEKKENKVSQLEKKVLACNEKIKETEAQLNQKSSKRKALEEKLSEERDAFLDYDAQYQAIASDKSSIEEEIAALSDNN